MHAFPIYFFASISRINQIKNEVVWANNTR